MNIIKIEVKYILRDTKNMIMIKRMDIIVNNDIDIIYKALRFFSEIYKNVSIEVDEDMVVKVDRVIRKVGGINETFKNIYGNGLCHNTTISKMMGMFEEGFSYSVFEFFEERGWMKRDDMRFFGEYTRCIFNARKFSSICRLIMEFFDIDVVVNYRDEFGQTVLDVLVGSLSFMSNVNEIIKVINFLERNNFDFKYVGNKMMTYVEGVMSIGNSYLVKRFIDLGCSICVEGNDHPILKIFYWFSRMEENFYICDIEHVKNKFYEYCMMVKFCIDMGYYDYRMKDKRGKTLRNYVEMFRKDGEKIFGERCYNTITHGF